VIPLLLFLVGLAIIYVGTVQAGFSAMMRLSMRIQAERGGRSDVLGDFLEDPSRLFVPVRLLLGLLIVAAAELLALLVGLASLHGAGVVLLGLAALLVVCEHLVPLLIIRRNPQTVLETLLPSFTVVSTVLAPLTQALRHLGRRPERVATGAEDDNGEPAPSQTEEARSATGAMEGGEERRLLRSIVGFGDRLVREVMTPRPDIVAIRSEATVTDLRAFFREQEYSRIPVFKDDIDNVLGFVFVKDLIKREDLPAAAPVTDMMRPAHFVPETKRVPELLKEFQRHQIQSAIVVDEYGGTAGLVTIEDLLEELVGEIRDEYDVESEPISQEAGGTFLVSGKVAVDQVSDRLDIAIEGEGFETFGGYLLSRLGRVPNAGERFEVDDLDVEVLDADRRRIQRVRVRKHEAAHEGS
jgi:CBS domain containing-hemolysin-like protein